MLAAAVAEDGMEVLVELEVAEVVVKVVLLMVPDKLVVEQTPEVVEVLVEKIQLELQ
jgi:hypothetical protein